MPKRLAQAFLEPQLLHHPVERGGELADLVLRGGDQRSAEVAGLDRPRTLQQSPYRTRHAGADQQREHQAEDGGEHGQEYGDQHHLLLLGYRLVGVLAQQIEHIRAYAIQLLVEVVAHLVDALEFVVDGLGLAGIEQGQHALVLRVETAAGIVIDGVQPGLEPAQRCHVGEARTLLDQPVNQGARGLDFQVDLSVQCIVAIAQRLVAGVVGRRLQLFDHDAAYRKRPLQRTDVGARQIAIGRDVSVRQILDAGADLHHQHHGQDRGNGHQHDQRHGDAHDLSSDRQSDHGKQPPHPWLGQAYRRCSGDIQLSQAA